MCIYVNVNVNQLISLKNTAQFQVVSRGVSEKCVFLCSNKWVNKQPMEMFCKKRYFKNFTNFTGKHLCWSRARPATILRSDSNTGVFL